MAECGDLEAFELLPDIVSVGPGWEHLQERRGFLHESGGLQMVRVLADGDDDLSQPLENQTRLSCGLPAGSALLAGELSLQTLLWREGCAGSGHQRAAHLLAAIGMPSK